MRFRDFLFESVKLFVPRQCCFGRLCVPVGTVETRFPKGSLSHLLNTGLQRHCGVISTGTAGSYDLCSVNSLFDMTLPPSIQYVLKNTCTLKQTIAFVEFNNEGVSNSYLCFYCDFRHIHVKLHQAES